VSANKKNILTTKEAASIVGRTSDYIGRLAREGKIPATRVGRSWTFKKKDLLEYFDLKEASKEISKEALSNVRKVEYKKTQTTKSLMQDHVARVLKQIPAENFVAFTAAILIVFGGYTLVQATPIVEFPSRAVSAIHEQAASVHRGLVRIGRSPSAVKSNYVVENNKENNLIDFSVASSIQNPLASVNAFSEKFSYRGVQREFEVSYVPSKEISITLESVWFGYRNVGESLVAASQNSLRGYIDLVDALGKESLRNAVAARDASRALARGVLDTHSSLVASYVATVQSAPEKYTDGVYSFVDTSFALANTIVQIPYQTGGLILSSAQNIPEANIKIGSAVREISPQVGNSLMQGYVAMVFNFVDATYELTDTYKKSIEVAGNGIGSTLAYTRFELPETIKTAVVSEFMESTDALYGLVEGAGEHIAHSYFVPSIISVRSLPESIAKSINTNTEKIVQGVSVEVSVLEDQTEDIQAGVVSGVSNTVENIFSRFFGRRSDPVLLVNPGPAQTNVVIREEAPTYVAPRNLTQNFYATTDVNRGYVDSSITSLHAALSAEIQKLTSANRNQIVQNIQTTHVLNRIEDLSDTILRRPEILEGVLRGVSIEDGSRFSGTSVSADAFTGGTANFATTTLSNLTVTGDTTFGGTLTVGGLATTGALTAPYFTATSTYATTTFAGSFAIDTDGFVYATSTGNVGIGVLSPAALFAIQNSTSTQPVATFSDDTGSELFRFTNGGNFGIGTTSPYEKLSVDGNGVFTGSLTAATSTFATTTLTGPLVGTSAEFSNATITSATSTNFYTSILTALTGAFTHFTATNATTTNATTTNLAISGLTQGSVPFIGTGGLVTEDNGNFFWDSALNRLGIGTSSPDTALEVDGVITAKGDPGTYLIKRDDVGTGLVIDGNGNIALNVAGGQVLTGEVGSANVGVFTTNPAFRFETEGSNDQGYFGVTNSTDGDIFQIDGSGNVGIGTTSPWAQLSVEGQGSRPGFVVADSSNNTDFIVSEDGLVGIGTSNPSAPLNVVIDTSTPPGSTQGILRFQTNTGSDDRAAKIGAVTGASGYVYFQGIRPGIGNDSYLVLNPIDGNVGVGDVTPAALFTVGDGDLFQVNDSGAIAAATGITSSGTITFSGLSDGVVQATSGVLSATSSISSSFIEDAYLLNTGDTATGDYTFDTDTFFIDSSADRVGFGTTTPQSPVHIYGTGGQTALIESADTGSAQFRLKNSTTEWHFEAWNNAFNFVESGVDIWLSILEGGNVGVGTTTPWAQLAVEGQGGKPSFVVADSSNNTDFIVTEGGNVGIGTNSPSALTSLDVDGNIVLNAATPVLYLGSDFDQSISANASSNYLSFTTANDEVARIYSNGGLSFGDDYVGVTAPADGMIIEGSVGIGTTSPYAKLSVVGQAVAEYFTATSTTLASTFPLLNTTNATTTQFAVSSLTSGRIPYATTGGRLIDSSSLTFDGTTATAPVLAASSASATSTFAGGLTVDSTDFVVDPDGNFVGIGIASKSSHAGERLRVQTGGGNPSVVVDASGSDASVLQFGNSTTGTAGSDGFQVGIDASENAILRNKEATDLIFYTSNDEKLRIDSSGNVGIGTSSPETNLDVYGTIQSSGATPNFWQSDSFANGLIHKLASENAGYSINVDSGDVSSGSYFRVLVDNDEKIRIDDNGDFGVGDASPDFRLETVGASTSGYFGITNSTDGDILTVDTSGNVGIGTTSPYAKLSVVGQAVAEYFTATTTSATSTLPNLSISNLLFGSDYINDITGNGLSVSNGVLNVSTTSLASGFFQQGGNSFGATAVLGTNDSNDLAFETGGSTRVTIDTSGYVGIGTTTPDVAELHIEDSSNNANIGAPQIRLTELGDAREASIYNRNGGLILVTHGADNAVDEKLSLDSGVISLFTGGTERFRINSSGDVGIGTTTPWGKLAVAGDGSGNSLVVADSSGNTDFVVTEDGKVGFGIAAPNAAYYQFAAPDNSLAVTFSDPNGNFRHTFGTDSNADPFWRSFNGTDLNLGIDSTNVLTIASTTNQYHVGIGTTTPWGKFAVVNTYATPSFVVADEAGDATPFLIDASGNVGIGSTTPNKKLVVGGGVRVSGVFTNDGIFVDSGSPANIFSLTRQDGVNNADLGVNTYGGFGVAVGETSVYSTPSESYDFYIDPSGNVGIGTTSPLHALTVTSGAISVSANSGPSSVVIDRTDGVVLSLTAGGAAGNFRFDSSGNFNISSQPRDDIQALNASNIEERLTVVGSSGNVGIGTTSPANLLHIYDGAAGAVTAQANSQLVIENSAQAAINLLSPNTSAQAIYFGDEDDNDIGDIRYNHSENSLRFRVNASERLRIDSSGNVGIGTTTPNYLLDVDGDFNVGEAGNAQSFYVDATAGKVAVGENAQSLTNLNGKGIIITNTAGGATGRLRLDVEDISSGYNTEIRVNDTGLEFEAASDSRNISLWTGATPTERLTVLGTGNVGIGDNAPSNALHITNTNPTIRLEDSDGSASIYSQVQSNGQGDLVFYADPGNASGSTQISFELDGSEVGRFNAGGNFGIGTTTPQSPFHVYSSTSGNQALIERSSDADVALGFKNSTQEWAVGIDQSDSNTFKIGRDVSNIGNSNSLSLTTGGNLGIGNVSPEELVHIRGSASPTIRIENSEGTVSATDVLGAIEFETNDSTATAGISAYINAVAVNSFGASSQRSALTFGTTEVAGDLPGVERLRIDYTGNVGIGETSPDAILHATADAAQIGFKVERTAVPTLIQSEFDGGDSAWYHEVNTGGTSYIQGIDDGDSDKWKISYGSAGNAAFGTNDYFTLDQTGNVGIGTTTPSDVLSVQGDVSFSEGSEYRSFYWDATNGRLGINTTVPGKRLTVALPDENDGISLTRSGWGTSSGIFLDDSYQSQNGLTIVGPSSRDITVGINGNDSSDGFAVYTDPSNGSSADTFAFGVFNNGNVGIGTTSPNTKLALAGSTDANKIRIENTGAGIVLDIGGRDATSDRPYLQARAYADYGTYHNLLLNPLGGNIGIGTSTPAYPLDVDGDLNVGEEGNAQALYVDAGNGRVAVGDNSSALSGLDGKGLVVSNNDGGAVGKILIDVEDISSGYSTEIRANDTGFQFESGSNSRPISFWTGLTPGQRLTILGGGNVGIGDAAPGSKLDVAGDINISDTTTGYKIGDNLILYGSTTSYNTAVGIYAGTDLLPDGYYNTALGDRALNVATSSDYNTAIGAETLRYNTTGSENTVVGSLAGENTTTGSYNTALGTQVLRTNTTGSFNTAVGRQSLYFNNGLYNTAIGYASSFNNTTGQSNVAAGYASLYSNKTGIYNVSLGQNALYHNNATSTVAIGYGAGQGSAGAASQNNVFLGFQSGTANSTGDNNIFLGYQAGSTATTGSGNIVIGYVENLSSVTASNELNIGGALYGDLSAGNIGIGTTTPWGKLSITSVATQPSLIIEDSSSPDSTPFLVDHNGRVAIGAQATNDPGLGIFLNAPGTGTVDDYLTFDMQGAATGVAGDGLGIQWRFRNTGGTYFQSRIHSEINEDGNGADIVFSPAPNSSSPTEALRITDAGNVGIGTTTPANLLHVYDGAAGAVTAQANSQLVIENSAQSAINLLSPNTSAQAIYFGDEDDNDRGDIRYNHSEDSLRFRVNASERLRIDSSGNVGIGTTTPADKLNVVDSGSVALTVRQTDAVANGKYAQFILSQGTTYYGASDSSWQIASEGQADGTSDIAFHNWESGSYAATDILYLASGGDIGIGTDDPLAKLHINGDTTGYEQIWTFVGGYSNERDYGIRGVNNAANTQTALHIDALDGSGVFVRNLLTLDHTGNIGIGTTTPDGKFSVESEGTGLFNTILTHYDDSTPVALIARSANGTQASPTAVTDGKSLFAFGARGHDGTSFSAGNKGVLLFKADGDWTGSNNGVDFSIALTPNGSTSRAEVFKITSDGNVGIGTTTPTSKLDIVHASSYLSSDSALSLRASADNASSLYLGYDDTENAGFIQSIESGVAFRPLLLNPNGGNVGIGTTTDSYQLTVDGEGVFGQGGDKYIYIDGDNGRIGFNKVPANTFELHEPSLISPLIKFTNQDTNERTIVGDGVELYYSNGGNSFNFYNYEPGGFVFYASSTQALNIAANGNATFYGSGGNCTINGSGACSSDERLKTNITEVTGTEALSKLSQISSNTYTWADSTWDQGQNVGVLAQEVLAVFPELVTEIPTTFNGVEGDYYALNYAGLTSPLIAGVNELNARTSEFTTIGGNIGIGTTTPSYKLHVLGDVAATSFVNISTRESKHGITYLDEARKEDILSKLKAVQIAEYRYNYESDDNPLRLGLIAEEAPSEILSVSGKGVDIYKLATFTLASVQEIALKLETLEERIAALEASGITGGTGVFSTTTLKSAFAELGILIEKGFAQFDKLAFKQLIAEKDGAGEAAAGTGSIATGSKLVLVENSQIKASSKVFITFTSPVVGSWFITDKANGSFQVRLDVVQTSDVSFDYFIVQTEKDQAPVSDTGVVDTEAPVITLIGANPYYIATGTAYVEPGISITDNVDQNLIHTLFVDGYPEAELALDTSVPGSHILTYKVLDTAGNLTTETRAVVVGEEVSLGSVDTGTTTPETTEEEEVVEEEAPVVEEEVVEEAPADTTAPTIALTGAAAIELSVGDSFTDEGATAADDVDGDLTDSVVVTGAVDTDTAGLYTLTYTVEDAAGNEASVSRIVTVAAVEIEEAQVEDVVE